MASKAGQEGEVEEVGGAGGAEQAPRIKECVGCGDRIGDLSRALWWSPSRWEHASCGGRAT